MLFILIIFAIIILLAAVGSSNPNGAGALAVLFIFLLAIQIPMYLLWPETVGGFHDWARAKNDAFNYWLLRTPPFSNIMLLFKDYVVY